MLWSVLNSVVGFFEEGALWFATKRNGKDLAQLPRGWGQRLYLQGLKFTPYHVGIHAGWANQLRVS